MQWLSAVKITESSGSSGESNKQSGETLKRILGLIESAFKDAESTGALYKIDDAQIASKTASSSGAKELSQLGDEVRQRADARQRSIPFRRKVRWALRDKKALGELVAKVS